MAAAGIIVTGDKELDRALARMEAKALKKLLPKAAKEAAKLTEKDYRDRVPVDTGTMRDAVARRVRRYKHKSLTGKFATRGGKRYAVRRVTAEDIGASVIIDRKKFYRTAKRRGKRLSEDRTRKEGFFYPSVVELGGRLASGQRPLTRSLYENEQAIRFEFIKAMRGLVGI